MNVNVWVFALMLVGDIVALASPFFFKGFYDEWKNELRSYEFQNFIMRIRSPAPVHVDDMTVEDCRAVVAEEDARRARYEAAKRIVEAADAGKTNGKDGAK